MSSRLQTLGKLEAKVVCQYVWGARQGHRDELILRDRDSTTTSSESSGEFLNERLWCLMDYYDPTSLVDNGANVVERYRFSAFGLRTIMSAGFTPLETSGFDWGFAFKGQFLDLDTGYYNYGYRYYSPELGRWLSRDPLAEMIFTNTLPTVDLFKSRKSLSEKALEPLYINSYNNPNNTIDFLGLAAGKCCLKSGPTYDPAANLVANGTIQDGKVSPTFTFKASFIEDKATNCCCACCEVHQCIKWAAGLPAPHKGFQAPENKGGNWYEDRDKWNERYGYRDTTVYHSITYAHGAGFENDDGDMYYNFVRFKRASACNYEGRDTPSLEANSVHMGTIWSFKLLVIDVCDPKRTVKATSAILTVQW